MKRVALSTTILANCLKPNWTDASVLHSDILTRGPFLYPVYAIYPAVKDEVWTYVEHLSYDILSPAFSWFAQEIELTLVEILASHPIFCSRLKLDQNSK